MSNVCAVEGCPSTTSSKSQKSLFRFPKDEKRCRRWAEACNFLHLLERHSSLWMYKSRYRVCSLHFEDKMYATKRKIKLHEDAIPTLRLRVGRSSNDTQIDENISETEGPMVVEPGASTTSRSVNCNLMTVGLLTAKPEVISSQTVTADLMKPKTLKTIVVKPEVSSSCIVNASLMSAGTLKAIVVKPEASTSKTVSANLMESPTLNANVVEPEVSTSPTVIADSMAARTLKMVIKPPDAAASPTVSIDLTAPKTSKAMVVKPESSTVFITPKRLIVVSSSPRQASSIASQITKPLSTTSFKSQLKKQFKKVGNVSLGLHKKLPQSKRSAINDCSQKQFQSLCEKFLPPKAAKLAKAQAALFEKKRRR